MSESDGDPWVRPAPADAARAAPESNGAELNGPTLNDPTLNSPGLSGSESNGTAPRLAPRPLDRPAVDDESAAAFGRPTGVAGAFSGGARPALPGGSVSTAPPPTALALAFGRPAGNGVTLQRPPGAGSSAASTDPALWSGDDDPWRNPGSTATLGPPPAGDGPATPRPPGEGARLSLREVLFGRRVQRRALVLLGLVALLVGAAGGLVGRLTADGASRLTDPGATLSSVTEGKERPPGSVADIAARTVPAVVSLEVRVGDEAGTGSGIVIQGDGYVLTNNHVVAPAAVGAGSRLDAIFFDGTRAPARIVGRDPKTDLAVVKVDVANPVVAAVGSSGGLAVGDTVIAVGSPLGLVGTVTQGIVSAVNRPVRLDSGESGADAVIDAIQTDAAINPGNSGGPLVDSTGAVIGINTAIRSIGATSGNEGGSIGLGFAIPIDTARAIAEELIRTGVVKHADLGVNARSVTDGATDGAQVQNVMANGPAAVAGIVEGDVIVKVGERPIAGADELVVAVRERQPGETVPVELVREGRPLMLSVVLASD
jgi:S1-C subfamily serine protease